MRIETYKNLRFELNDGTRSSGRAYFAMAAYRGTAKHPFSNFTYPSYLSRIAALNEICEAEDGRERVKADRRERSRRSFEANAASYKVGDVLVYQWGYEQTNTEFYEIIDRTKARLKVRPVAQRTVRATGPMAEMVEAIPGKYTGPERTIHLTHDGLPSFRHGVGQVWDGSPAYASYYA